MYLERVAEDIGGTGGDRIDHGLDAAESPKLVDLIKEKSLGMTICPWAYVRHHTEANLFGHVRILFDAGIKITIGTDGPALMEENWVTDNLILLKQQCGFTNDEIVTVEKNAVEICWAGEETKKTLMGEIDRFADYYITR